MSEQQQLSDVVKSEQLSGGESHFKVHTGILFVTKLSFNNNCIHRGHLRIQTLLPVLELFPADQNTCGMLNKTKCGRACAAAGTIHWSVGDLDHVAPTFSKDNALTILENRIPDNKI